MDNKYEFNEKELKIADKVADELLIRKREHVLIWLFLLLLVFMCSFFPALIFSRIGYHSKPVDNFIQDGAILFSYEEGSNGINLIDAMPTEDRVGKAMYKDGEYFKFRIALDLKHNHHKKRHVTYEISLTPKITELDPKYVRVYLVQDGKELLINGNYVNNFSDLPDSKIRKNSKLLYKTEVSDDFNKSFVFKMWLSDKYEVKKEKETFSCYLNVDAY